MQQEWENVDVELDAPFIAARIRSACLRKGWDSGELARRAGISRTTLYHLERGATSRPRVSTLSRIATALGMAPDFLLIKQPETSSASMDDTRSTTGEQQQRDFDRATNSMVDEVRRERPNLFADWNSADWDEIYSEFGTGGQLSQQGVVSAAERMNLKRETIQQLQVVLETHLNDVATNMIETLYRMVQPESNLATTPELTALLARHQGELENRSPSTAEARCK